MTSQDILDAIRAAMPDARNWGLDRYEFRKRPNSFRASLAVPALGNRFRVECDIEVTQDPDGHVWISDCGAFDTYCNWDSPLGQVVESMSELGIECVILANMVTIPIFNVMYENKECLV